jgi:hypothetical protein
MTVMVRVVIATASEAWREAIPSFFTYATASLAGEGWDEGENKGCGEG